MSSRPAFYRANFLWKSSLFVAAIVALLYAPFVLSSSVDVFFLTLVLLCPASAIITLALLSAALVMRKANMAIGLMVNAVTVALVSVTMFSLPFYEGRAIVKVEDQIYWLLFSKQYKAALQSQPPNSNELRHISWQSSGFVGWTDSWLAFDPSGRVGDFKGRDGFVPNIPCPVYGIEALSKNYFIVYNDDDTSWDYCPDATRH